MIASFFQGAEDLDAKVFAWTDKLGLRLDEQELARARLRRALHDTEDGARSIAASASATERVRR